MFVTQTFREEIMQISRGILPINLNLKNSWVNNQNINCQTRKFKENNWLKDVCSLTNL